MAEILPAIMPNSFEDLREKLSLVSGLVKTVQIDIMDGRFVEPRSWPYNSRTHDQKFEQILQEDEGLPFWDRLDFEMDLMVANPEQEAPKWIVAGASRLIIHLESISKEVTKIFEEVKNTETEVGIALDMQTPIEDVIPFVDNVDLVQLMGIAKIGFQGNPFDERVIERVKELKKMAPSTLISIDGGVSLETAPTLIAAGADRLVVGSAIFKSADIEGTIREFQYL